MKKLAFLGLIAVLASCGVDGSPLPPSENNTPPPGVSVSGDMRMGVVKEL